MLASVRPRDLAGKTRRRIAAEELDELIRVETKMKKATAELKTIVAARDSQLMSIYGIGPVVAARILADAQRAALAVSAELTGAGPGGHCGATQNSSAVDLPPRTDTSDQSLAGPAKPTLQPRRPIGTLPTKKALEAAE